MGNSNMKFSEISNNMSTSLSTTTSLARSGENELANKIKPEPSEFSPNLRFSGMSSSLWKINLPNVQDKEDPYVKFNDLPEPPPLPRKTQTEPICDTVVHSVVEKFIERSNLGKQKYGTTLDRTDLSTDEWANHMQEELMDAILYLERLRRELPKKK
jgi:hypothetical protein